MENNYQEKILDRYNGFGVVQDCFAISRIQSEILSLSHSAAFNANKRGEMEQKYNELDQVLSKYPDAVMKTKR